MSRPRLARSPPLTARPHTVSGLLHSPPGGLFTVPSRYSALSVQRRRPALEGGPPVFPRPCRRGTRADRRARRRRRTGFSPSRMARSSALPSPAGGPGAGPVGPPPRSATPGRAAPLRGASRPFGPDPRSLATTRGLACCFGVPGTTMVRFPGLSPDGLPAARPVPSRTGGSPIRAPPDRSLRRGSPGPSVAGHTLPRSPLPEASPVCGIFEGPDIPLKLSRVGGGPRWI